MQSALKSSPLQSMRAKVDSLRYTRVQAKAVAAEMKKGAKEKDSASGRSSVCGR